MVFKCIHEYKPNDSVFHLHGEIQSSSSLQSQPTKTMVWMVPHTLSQSPETWAPTYLYVFGPKNLVIFQVLLSPKAVPKDQKSLLTSFPLSHQKALKSKWTRGLMWIFTLVDLDPRKKVISTKMDLENPLDEGKSAFTQEIPGSGSTYYFIIWHSLKANPKVSSFLHRAFLQANVP